MMKKFILFPHPKKKNIKIYFKKCYFINSNDPKKKYKILEYSKNYDGWSEELTESSNKYIKPNHPIDVNSQELCQQFLKKYINKNKSIILEIGCSNGHLIKSIIKKNYYYIGSDAIKNNIVKLSSVYKKIPFLVFDLINNPFKTSICNLIIMLNVLEHIKNDNKGLMQANKLLHKNGILILEVPAAKFLYDNYDKELMHFRRYNMIEIVKKIEKAGFIIEEKTHIGFLAFPFFMIVKLFNRFFKTKNIVTKQTNYTNSWFLKFLFRLDKYIINNWKVFGIRCFIIARKK